MEKKKNASVNTILHEKNSMSVALHTFKILTNDVHKRF